MKKILNEVFALAALSTGCFGQGTTVTLAVTDPRPVAKAVLEVERRSGVAINYEDPRIVFAGDLEDITNAVVTAEQREMAVRSGRGPVQIIVPRSRVLAVPMAADATRRTPWSLDALTAALTSVVASNNALSDRPASFRVTRINSALFVEPVDVRDESGARVATASVLSSPITLEQVPRTAVEALESILREASKAARVRIDVGALPMRLFASQVTIGANSEPANEVLMRLFRSLSRDGMASTVHHPSDLSYRLLYDSQLRYYLFNIHRVGLLPDSMPASEARGASVPSTPPAGTDSSRWFIRNSAALLHGMGA